MLPMNVQKHFKQKDPTLAALSDTILDVSLHPTKEYFRDLCESIVCQQLSGKAAASIWKKFTLLVGKNNIRPEHIVTMDEAVLRTSGISWSKATYVKNVASAFLDNTVTPDAFTNMEDADIIGQLVKIKGVGQWTAEMFLMFSLGREDVFSFGDLGLRRALQKTYALKREPTVKQMGKITSKWTPYRTYGALLLWRSLDKV